MAEATYERDRRAIAAGRVTCQEVVDGFLERIEERNGRLNAFLSVDGDAVRGRAGVLDEATTELPLKGMVVGVKDNVSIADQPLSCGSRMLSEFRAVYTATAVERLEAAGAIVVGKLNCDEFAMGSSNETSYFGPVRNPLDERRVPGGSSGGSAAALASGMCHVSLGSDTGGSVRLPAAFCGVVGLKPTYGRVSRYGLVAHASSLDCIGVLANAVVDAAGVLSVIAGVDPLDATSAPIEVPDFAALARSAATNGLEGMRVGLPAEYFGEGLDGGVREAVDEASKILGDAGAELKSVSLPHTRYGVATYYVIATAEASSNLARYDGIRFGHRSDAASTTRSLQEERGALEQTLAAAEQEGDDHRVKQMKRLLERHDTVLVRLYTDSRTEGFGEEVKRRIMLGTYVLSAGYYDAYYARAQRARTLIRQDFDRAFEHVDLLLTPAAPTPAFKLGEKATDPLEMYLSDIYTVTANLAGIPALVVPARHRHPSGLPVGLQLLAPHFHEAALLRAGAVLEGQ